MVGHAKEYKLEAAPRALLAGLWDLVFFNTRVMGYRTKIMIFCFSYKIDRKLFLKEGPLDHFHWSLQRKTQSHNS